MEYKEMAISVICNISIISMQSSILQMSLLTIKSLGILKNSDVSAFDVPLNLLMPAHYAGYYTSTIS